MVFVINNKNINSYLKCPNCNYISDDYGLMNREFPCKKCNHKDEFRENYPDLSSLKIIEMIEKYSKHRENEEYNVIDKIKKLVPAEDEIIKGVLIEAHNIFVDNKLNYDESLSKSLEIIRHKLVDDIDKANKILFIAPDFFSMDVDKIITVFTCTLLEDLLKNLLCDYIEVKGCPAELSHVFIYQDGYSIHKIESFFNRITGAQLKKMIDLKNNQYYSEWKYIKSKRNDFIHGNPFVIGLECFNKAINVASEAIPLFASLHNELCLKNV